MSKHYYWIVTQDDEGRPYLVYGGETEEDARREGLEMLGGLDFQIRKLPTRDKNTASSYIRGKRLKETHSLKEASKKIGRKRSLRRLLNR